MNINLDIKINNNYIDSFPVEFIDKLKTEIEIYYKTNKEQVD
jgi:translation initiation factor 2B subunit (eIF-2B alpha/beta/delta family)